LKTGFGVVYRLFDGTRRLVGKAQAMRKQGNKTRYPGVKMISPGWFQLRGRMLDPRTGQRKEVTKLVEAASPKEAFFERTKMLSERPIQTNQRIKVGTFAELWIESKAAVVSEYTLKSYADALQKHVLPVLGNYYYDDVGHLDVQAMVNQWLAIKKDDGRRRYALESMRDWFRVFRNMTHDAIAQLNLERDPTLRISFGNAHAVAEDAARDPLTIDEAERLLSTMKETRPASFALLSAKKYTGQRFCHVSALKLGDIDWSEMLLHFRRKQVRGKVGPISKKKPVPRVIPMLPELARVLLEHCRRLGRLGYPVDGDAWLFPTANGTLKQPSSLVNAIRRSAKEAGLAKRITPHMMRYLFNDVLRLAGVDQVTRKALTGHVTNEMTEHYSTVRLDEKRAAMEAVATLLTRKSGTKGGTRAKNGEAA
jgi:integrase